MKKAPEKLDGNTTRLGEFGGKGENVRGDKIEIDFQCEHDSFYTLIIRQHKGMTLTHWREIV